MDAFLHLSRDSGAGAGYGNTPSTCHVSERSSFLEQKEHVRVYLHLNEAPNNCSMR